LTTVSAAPGAYVHFLPNIGGFVGADHVSMLLATGIFETDKTVIGVDIGTNTEVTLASDGRLSSVSCASGPAFEGAGIRCGIRAANGAIEKIGFVDEKVQFEVIGDMAPIYDAMMIDQGKRFLKQIGASEFVIELNSIGCTECRAEYKNTLSAFLAPKRDSLCDDCKRRIERNFLRIFDCKNEHCQKIYDQAPKITDSLCAECADHYKKVHQYLHMLDVPFSENKKLVRGLDYYTRTVFEFKTGAFQAQDTILAGGRYDMLMHELGGQDTPALGWAMGVDRLLLTMPDTSPLIESKKVVFIAAMGETYIPATLPICETLHTLGFVCVYGNPDDTIKKQMKSAHRLRVDYVVIYGEQEARDEVCAIKDMESGEQKNVPIHTLSQYIRSL